MVTISDVARAAGVSTSTVSYVLSGKRTISPETRERVHRSIRELGYHPHAGARALASSRTRVVALVAPLRADMVVRVIMQVATAVVTAARDHDHDVLLLTKEEGAAGIERVSGGAMVDALIVMDVESRDERVPVLAALRQPTVLIGLPDDHEGLYCVDLDFTLTGELAAQHLIELGHRGIGFIGSPAAVFERGTSYATRITDGFRRAADEAGVFAVTTPCEATYSSVENCLDLMERQPHEITGLVVHNELALSPLLDLLQARGRRVPEDVSVVAVCPPDVAEDHRVRLTSIDIPTNDLGGEAVRMVMQQLEGDTRPEVRLLAPRLTPRSSTAPRR